jgi:hypothetical protein
MFEHPETMRQIVNDRTHARQRAAEEHRLVRRPRMRRRVGAIRTLLARH